MRVVSWGQEYKVDVREERSMDGNLALQVDYFDEELQGWLPFARLTVNLGIKLGEDEAFVDTNNCPWATGFIDEYGLGERTGLWMPSGFCEYPLYRFNMEKIRGLGKE